MKRVDLELGCSCTLYTYLMYTYMKSFIAKRVISILVNLRYLRFKLLKYKENNKKMCNNFDHNFKNIPLYIMSNVSLERYYFVLYDGALTLKMSKLALNVFCDRKLFTCRSANITRNNSITFFSICFFFLQTKYLSSNYILVRRTSNDSLKHSTSKVQAPALFSLNSHLEILFKYLSSNIFIIKQLKYHHSSQILSVFLLVI